MDFKDSLSVPVPLFLLRGGPHCRYQLALSPLERKALIALAVSGEPESLSDLAMATEIEPEQLPEVLASLAAKGIVRVVNVESAADPLPEPEPASILSFPQDLFGEKDRESALPDPVAPAPTPAPTPTPTPALAFDLSSLQSRLESLRDRNYYEILGLDSKATRAEIRTAYFDLVSDFHPDRHRECADPQVLETLAELFGLITLAYETLNSKKRRKLYDRTIPRFTGAIESEEEIALSRLFEETGETPAASSESEKPQGWNFYQAAVEAFQAGDFHIADLNFKLASGMDPDRPEYREGIQRTREIINKGALEGLKREAKLLEEKKKFREAVVTLLKAVELDPVDPELRLALARLRFMKTMDRDRAEEDVSWAVSLDPNNLEALLLMGRIQAWKGNTAAAIATFKQVLRLVPGHPKAKQALALFEK